MGHAVAFEAAIQIQIFLKLCMRSPLMCLICSLVYFSRLHSRFDDNRISSKRTELFILDQYNESPLSKNCDAKKEEEKKNVFMEFGITQPEV